MLAVCVVAQLAVLLVGIGRWRAIGPEWLLLTTVYAQSVGLISALSVCTFRSWLARTSSRGAWMGSWLIILIVSISWSYLVGVVGSVLGLGPGRGNLNAFMLQSLLAVSLVSAALLRYLFIRAQWQAEITAQAEARVQALQARIRPHFLFNSLNTISSLIPDDPESAETATLDLADLFRGSMRRADRMIPLSDELDLARKYLDIEHRRLGDRLKIDWRVDELPGDLEVLPLLLQPLLENAIAHGIQHCADGGTVRVYGRSGQEGVVMTLSNPLSRQVVPGGDRQQHHGMALRNIRSRLEWAYGDRASLITHENDEQFVAVLTLPHDEDTDR